MTKGALTPSTQYRCFIRGDWENGVPNLALGSDAALRSLAEQEVVQPDTAAEQAELADGWWDAAAKEKGVIKTRMQLRAGSWYNEAVTDLAGLKKVRVTKRLEQLAEIEESTGGRVGRAKTGFKGQLFLVINGKGNVYLNGHEIRFSNHRSPVLRLNEGDILVMRIYSDWGNRGLRMAFVSTDSRVVLPFKAGHFRRMHGSDVTVIDGNAIARSTETMRLADSVSHSKEGRPTRQRWAELRLPENQTRWIFGPSKKVWYTYACVITRDMFLPALKSSS